MVLKYPFGYLLRPLNCLRITLFFIRTLEIYFKNISCLQVFSFSIVDCSVILIWSENLLHMILVFLNLHFLCESVPSSLEKCVVDWNASQCQVDLLA